MAVLQKAAEMPLAIALRAASQEMSYWELRTRIVRYALQMRLRGIDRTSCVVLDANRMPEGLALQLALALLGARWMRLSPDIPYEDFGVTQILTVRQRPAASPAEFIKVDESWALHPTSIDASKPISFDGFASADDIVYFGQSSGTTGRPKFMAKNCEQVWRRIHQNYVEEYSITFSGFLPLSAIGFHANVGALLKGACLAVGGRSIGELEILGVSSVKASPNQISGLCRDAGSPTRKIPALYAAGSVVSSRQLQLWSRYFERIDLGYGSQETGIVGRSQDVARGEATDVDYTLEPDVRVEIVDGDGRICPTGGEGIVRIRAPLMADHYIAAPEATKEAFRDGWFYPGDLGMLTRDGRLRILGREKDQFNFGGVKANAADIDAAVCKISGVVNAVSFARAGNDGADELCVLAVAPGLSELATATRIRQECARLRGPDLLPAAIYFGKALPLNDGGKPSREMAKIACRQLVPY